MSDTPKTDAVAFYITNDHVRREAVFADFARAQERRIAELEDMLFRCDSWIGTTKTGAAMQAAIRKALKP